jgi:hypothetical protein
MFYIPNWHTHRFLYHSKWIKNEEDMGFETREGLEFFSKKIEIKYHIPFSYFSYVFFLIPLFLVLIEILYPPICVFNDIKLVQFG